MAEGVSGPRSTTLGLVARAGGRGGLLAAGVGAFVLALKGLIQPNQLLAGGIGGLSLLVERFSGVPVGLLYLAFNVPVFAVGVRHLGRRFAAYSAVAVVGFWALADWLPIPRFTDDPLLAAIFGGAISGIGTALALRAGGSLGGFDILAVVLNRSLALGVGEALWVLNGCLVVAAGLVSSAETAMYTLIGIFATRWTIDSLTSTRPRKATLIISRRPLQISERVLTQMRRGMTVFPARGAWTGEEVAALLCVITPPELPELEEIVREEDADAFTVVLEVAQVRGAFRRRRLTSYLQRLMHPAQPSRTL